MKKYIWISLLILFTSCGSRKSAVEKTTQTEETKTSQELTTKTESETKSETTFDFAKFLEAEEISIVPDGNPYTLSYKGLSFTGSSAVNIANKKEQTKIKWVQKVETIYKAVTQYQTETRHKTHITHKTKATDRKAFPWYYIAIGTLLLWELLKLGIKKAFPAMNLGGLLSYLKLKR